MNKPNTQIPTKNPHAIGGSDASMSPIAVGVVATAAYPAAAEAAAAAVAAAAAAAFTATKVVVTPIPAAPARNAETFSEPGYSLISGKIGSRIFSTVTITWG